MTTTDLTDYTAGLRALADLIDNNPDLPRPHHGGSVEQLVFVDTKEELQTYLRAMTGRTDKDVTEDGVYDFSITGQIHGLKVKVYIRDREQVCTKVVKGTREVTREVPDPTVTVPLVTVTETVEDVEWICEPLTAPVSA